MTNPILSDELVRKVAEAMWESRDCHTSAHHTMVVNALTAALPLIQAELLRGMMEPNKGMVEAGETELENFKDSSWDSGPDGEGSNSYEYYNSGAAKAMFVAMLRAYMLEQKEDGE